MIAVDTTALMAIVLNETAAEALIVAGRRSLAAQIERLDDGLGFTVVPVRPAAARRVAAAYGRWGRGAHPVGLNFGDCFAYDVARQHDWPLLFVGNDFGRTDVRRALARDL